MRAGVEPTKALLMADSQGMALACPEAWIRVKKFNEGREPVPVGKDYRIISSPWKNNRSLQAPPSDETDELGADTDGEEDDDDEATVLPVIRTEEDLDDTNVWRAYTKANRPTTDRVEQ